MVENVLIQTNTVHSYSINENYTKRRGTTMKVVMPTVFPKPGTYSTNKIHVNIMSLSNDAHIYYTLDGSEPTANSTVFNMGDGLLTLKLDEPAALDENRTNQDTSKEK